ncbi:MAG: sigma-54-dependent Fis family transcriptional regulator, partial [Calditrichaeota bacterium]
VKKRILILDDQRQFLADMATFLSDRYEILLADNSTGALDLFRTQAPDVVILDLKLNENIDGLDVLRLLKREDPDIPVIIVTEFPTIETAIEAIKLGAFAYQEKTPHIKELIAIIEQQIDFIPFRRILREEETEKYPMMRGKSPATQEVIHKINQLSQIDVPVLIQGESGTGKALAAHMLHKKSARAAHAFFVLNCSTLAPQLFESEFFGHEQGAFTGAIKRKRGKYELANNGTLLLDEIADLPLPCQAKLLDTIEYGRFQRLGGEEVLHADVRILAATNRNMKEMIEKNIFREDLYYRLNVIKLEIPPLRERKQDILPLARHYLEKAALELRIPIPQIEPEIAKFWQNYAWPGNVRELKNRMMQVAFEFQRRPIELQGWALSDSSGSDMQEIIGFFKLPYAEAKQKVVEWFKRKYILQALKNNNSNISKTADATQMNRATIHRTLTKSGKKRE